MVGRSKRQRGANLRAGASDRVAGKRPVSSDEDDAEYVPQEVESGDADSDGDAQVGRGDPNPLGTALGRA